MVSQWLCKGLEDSKKPSSCNGGCCWLSAGPLSPDVVSHCQGKELFRWNEIYRALWGLGSLASQTQCPSVAGKGKLWASGAPGWERPQREDWPGHSHGRLFMDGRMCLCNPSLHPGAEEVESSRVDLIDLWKTVRSPSLPNSLFVQDGSTRDIDRTGHLIFMLDSRCCLRWALCAMVG
jgi:hypothetical protein